MQLLPSLTRRFPSWTALLLKFILPIGTFSGTGLILHVFIYVPLNHVGARLRRSTRMLRSNLRARSFWRVHVPVVSDLLAAVEVQQRHRISFWDAMIIRSAQASGLG